MENDGIGAILDDIAGLDDSGYEIIEEEWRMFSSVRNQGGKASCQYNPHEFCLTRAGQMLSWPQELREHWLDDLREAKAEGRNLMTEKYARMMASTHPDEYARLSEFLPPLTEKQREVIEELVTCVVGWAEETAREYPAIAAGGRPIHSCEDIRGFTSIETYARGEISTYGLATLHCTQSWYDECRRNGINPQQVADRHLAVWHGFPSLDAAEKACRRARGWQQ
jgi:hypothetical protein